MKGLEAYSQDFQEKTAHHQEANPDDLTFANNDIQRRLIGRFFGCDATEEQVNSWFEKNARKFGALIKDHPEMLERYLSGDDEAVLEEIPDLLYENQLA
jgi:hypothetical protein